jgi:hypothetical protein
MPRDRCPRLQYCERRVRENERDFSIVERNLQTNAAPFTHESVLTSIGHLLVRHVLHVTRCRGHQVRWGIDCWSTTVVGSVTGPSNHPPPRLVVSIYYVFLRCAGAACQGLFAATDHCGLSVIRLRPISISSLVDGLDMVALVLWPARSPDLKPPDFFVREHLKGLV